MDDLLAKQQSGPLFFKIPAVALLMADAIHQAARSDYILHAWVILPNHVHLLITPHIDPARLLRLLKGRVAREANRVLGRTGQPFWQDESYDRLVRDGNEFRRVRAYIVANPVRAGLCASPDDYRWSSEWRD